MTLLTTKVLNSNGKQLNELTKTEFVVLFLIQPLLVSPIMLNLLLKHHPCLFEPQKSKLPEPHSSMFVSMFNFQLFRVIWLVNPKVNILDTLAMDLLLEWISVIVNTILNGKTNILYFYNVIMEHKIWHLEPLKSLMNKDIGLVYLDDSSYA